MKMHLSTSILCGLAAAVTLGLSAAANAQATTDSTVRTTRSTTRVTSTRRIPVRKDGSTTTNESTGAMAKPNADSLARADSMTRADAMMRAHQDSIAMAERMHQDSIAAMQRAHQDSIAMADRMRQDSIARADSLMRWNAARAKMVGSGLYFQVGSPDLIGGGVTRFTNYSNTTPFVNSLGGTNSGTSMTKGQWNAGAGISFGVRMTRVFVESRYMHVATPGNATTFIPIIIGISL